MADTTLLKFTVLSSLAASLRAEAQQANLSLNQYLITILNARGNKPVVRPATLAEQRKTEVEAQQEARKIKVKSRYMDYLTIGPLDNETGLRSEPVTAPQIRATWHNLTPVQKQWHDSILREALAEAGLVEGQPTLAEQLQLAETDSERDAILSRLREASKRGNSNA